MTDLLDKAGSGSVEPEDFNAVVDAIESGPTGKVTAADIDSLAAQNGDVLTADGAGNATWETGGGIRVVTLPFAFDTPSLNAGLTVATMQPGEAVFACSLSNPVAWTVGADSMVADNPPVAPLTVVMGVNDQFILNPAGAVFTVAPGVYTTAADCAAAMGAAVDGSVQSFDPNYTTVTLAAGKITLTGGENPGDHLNIGTGEDVLIALGFTDGQTFSGGAAGLTLGSPGDSDGLIALVDLTSAIDQPGTLAGTVVLPAGFISSTTIDDMLPLGSSPQSLIVTVDDGAGGPSGALSGEACVSVTFWKLAAA